MRRARSCRVQWKLSLSFSTSVVVLPPQLLLLLTLFFKCELWLLMLLLLSSGTELILSWLMSTTVSKLGDLVVVKIVEEAR